MFKNREQLLKEQEFVENNFDEEDDIYIPDNIFDEIHFICYMFWYIHTHPEKREIEQKYLNRQIGMYKLLRKAEWKNNKFRLWLYKIWIRMKIR